MLNDKMKKMLSKKKDLGSDSEKSAKMDVIQHLHDLASEAMKDHMDGLKKVSVASDSPEGLKHGLDKAKEILSNPEHEAMLEDAEDPNEDIEDAASEHEDDDDSDESQEDDGSDEHPEESEEEIDQKLQDLMEKKKKFQAKRI